MWCCVHLQCAVIHNIGETLINMGPVLGARMQYGGGVVCTYSAHVIYNIGETLINMGLTQLFSISVLCLT